MDDSENGNGNKPTTAENENNLENDEEPIVGPGPAPQRRPKRPLQFEQAYLDALPSANMYEKSYMHRDVVTHVAVSPADFFITGSCDGHLKFWKKKSIGIEFAKHFRAHLGPIEGLAVSLDGLLCCTISSDHSVKVYDVVNYDMMVMLRLPFIPGAVEWVYKQGDVKSKLAISDRNSPSVYIYDVLAGTNEPVISKEIHMEPVKVMKYNPVFDSVISVDTSGMIEYWSPETLQFPESGVKFRLKTDTSLLEILRCKTSVSSIERFLDSGPEKRSYVGHLGCLPISDNPSATAAQRHSCTASSRLPTIRPASFRLEWRRQFRRHSDLILVVQHSSSVGIPNWSSNLGNSLIS